MKNRTAALMAALALVVSTMSLNALAASKAEQQEDIQKMAEQSLQQLYKAEPLAKAAVGKAAGYAVFSDLGIKILFGGSGNGEGIAINSKTHQKTYMKMVELQAGLGFGLSKFRNIFVFENEKALSEFINSGWQFGGQATAGAVAANEGGAMSGAVSVAPGVWLYQLTEKGLNLSVTMSGAKYYKNNDLN